MGSLMKIIVFLTVISAVLCTPFINKVKVSEEATDVEKAEAAVIETELISNKDTLEEPVKVNYSGYQVWKLPTTKASVRKVINKLVSKNLIETWGGNRSSIDVLVGPSAIKNVKKVLKSKRITYHIMIEDLQRNINEENPPLEESEIELQNRQGHRMTWKRYHRLNDIHEFMDYLAKTYPSFVSVKTIGMSHEGRELKVLRISDGKPTNKAVFIDGGIHAREWISPAVVTYFINQFAENFDVESKDIRNIDWYFLPVLNPDGYMYSHRNDRLWRKNRRYGVAPLSCTGIDLNRNFGYKWGGKGASINPCKQTYRGSSAFSEPESKAFAAIEQRGGSEYIVGPSSKTVYSAAGDSVDWVKAQAVKYTYTVELSDTGRYGFVLPASYIEPVARESLAGLRVLARQTIQNTGGSEYTVGSSSATLYPASGGSDDWVKSIGVKYTYTVELSDTGRYGFLLPASYIEPVARESLAGLRVLAGQVNKE